MSRGGVVDNSLCRTFSSLRSIPNDPIRVGEVGTYVVTGVADIEEDGTISIVEDIVVYGHVSTDLDRVTTVVSEPIESGYWIPGHGGESRS